MFGLPDEEALDRANRNIQAILDGDDSLRQYMGGVLDAFFVWLQIDEDCGPGWLVGRFYRTRREWLLRHLGAGDEEAEESAREVSQRMAEGQSFRANEKPPKRLKPRRATRPSSSSSSSNSSSSSSSPSDSDADSSVLIGIDWPEWGTY